jgi:2-dehydropantoate 2-reductase
MRKKRNIAIVGAGGVGGIVGAYLTKNGERVTLVDPWPEHVETMRRNGLTARGATAPENFTVPVTALHVGELQQVIRDEPFDIVFMAVKSYDTLWATQLIKQYLSPDGYVVSLQNGLNEESIASIVGWGKVLGCVVAVAAVELVGPGLVQRNCELATAEYPGMRVGEVHGRITARVQELVEMLACCDASIGTPNLWGERWSKLVVNAMRNPVVAATGLTSNENDRNPAARLLTVKIASEGVQVGRALGYELVKIYRMEPGRLAAAGGGDRDALKECEDVLLGLSKYRNDAQMPSMAQDIKKGRRTEIDFLNGLVAKRAEEFQIDTPYNRNLAEVIRRIERGKQSPSPDLLEKVLSSVG